MRRAILVATLLLVAGCDSEPPTVGTAVTFATVCEKANEDKHVALEGYLDFPGQFKAKDVTIMMRLRPTPFSAKDDRVVGASIKLGTRPNHVALPPRKYTANDIKVTTNDGKTVGASDRVRVSGTMYYPISTTNVEFKCGLSNTLIESARSSSK